MRFLLVSVSGKVAPKPVEVRSLRELVAFLDYDDEASDLIISRRSLVSMAHDRKQDKARCSHVLCVYDDFVELPRIEGSRAKRETRSAGSSQKDAA